ncbi:hypothetical protein ACFRMN_37480 [Streptomyces sp. NPDC056835]
MTRTLRSSPAQALSPLVSARPAAEGAPRDSAPGDGSGNNVPEGASG